VIQSNYGNPIHLETYLAKSWVIIKDDDRIGLVLLQDSS
jgi:hypothetical protein